MLQIAKKQTTLEHASSDCCQDEVIQHDTLISSWSPRRAGLTSGAAKRKTEMKGLGYSCMWCKNQCKPVYFCSECEQEIDDKEDQAHGVHSRCAYLFLK